MAWDGTLSVEDFERAALHLVATWEQCCPELPQWTWQKTVPSAIPGRTCGYLMLQDRVSSDREDDVGRVDESDGEDHDAEDQATMYEGLVGDHEQHLYTYHVVYNESYRVPMLFLQDGRPLQWNSVLQDLPVGSQHISNESRWTFLTQEDHPLFHRPWFALHPCGTSEIMRLVFSDFGIPPKAASIPDDLSDVSGGREKQVPHESSCGMADSDTGEYHQWRSLRQMQMFMERGLFNAALSEELFESKELPDTKCYWDLMEFGVSLSKKEIPCKFLVNKRFLELIKDLIFFSCD